MDADAIFRLISSRCGDVLAPADLAAVESLLHGADRDDEIAALIVDALDALQERLDRLEEAVACG